MLDGWVRFSFVLWFSFVLLEYILLITILESFLQVVDYKVEALCNPLPLVHAIHNS
jgi:hypothetical protein